MLLPYFHLTILVDCKDNINLYFTKKALHTQRFFFLLCIFLPFPPEKRPGNLWKIPGNPAGEASNTGKHPFLRSTQ